MNFRLLLWCMIFMSSLPIIFRRLNSATAVLMLMHLKFSSPFSQERIENWNQILLDRCCSLSQAFSCLLFQDFFSPWFPPQSPSFGSQRCHKHRIIYAGCLCLPCGTRCDWNPLQGKHQYIACSWIERVTWSFPPLKKQMIDWSSVCFGGSASDAATCSGLIILPFIADSNTTLTFVHSSGWLPF